MVRYDWFLAKNQSGCCRFDPCFLKATLCFYKGLNLKNRSRVITYLEDDFQLEMNEEVYHQCVMQLSRVTTTKPSPAQTEPASGGHTSRGRPLHIDYENNCSKIIRKKGKKKDKQNKP